MATQTPPDYGDTANAAAWREQQARTVQTVQATYFGMGRPRGSWPEVRVSRDAASDTITAFLSLDQGKTWQPWPAAPLDVLAMAPRSGTFYVNRADPGL